MPETTRPGSRDDESAPTTGASTSERSPREEDGVRQDGLPSTLRRSGDKAQRTFARAHDAAAEQYGDERRAHQVAFAALKHTHEKIGDHWEPKEEPGPSDDRAAGGRDTEASTAGGVDARASKRHLLDVARRLEIRGRSRMSKAELVEAIGTENDRRTRRARS